MRTKKVRPFTRKQFLAWLEKQRGWGEDMTADHGEEFDLGTAAHEMADGLLHYPDLNDGADRVLAYLRSTGVPDVVGCLTDYLYDVARPRDPDTPADLPYLNNDGTPDLARIADDVHDGDLGKGDELPESAEDGQLFLHVSDHGNIELYQWDANGDRQGWRSLWSRV